MKKYTIFSLLCIVPFFLFSQEITKFNRVENLSSTEIIKDIPLMGIGRIYFTDSLFITQDIRAKENYLTVYNYKDNSLFIQFGKKGKGPKQMITPYLISLSDDERQLIFYDSNIKKIHFCNLEDFNDIPSKIISLKDVDLRRIWKARVLDDNFIIAKGMFENGLFALINIKSNEFTIQGELPFHPKGSSKNNFFWELNQGSFFLSPDKKKVIYTAMNFGYIACYSFDGTRLTKTWEHWVTKPKYIIDNGRIRWKQNNTIGFMNSVIANDKIYAIFHGKDMPAIRSSVGERPETIMVFSLDGKPLAKYKTDKPIVRIGANPNGEIYGIALDVTYDLIKFNF
jgi:hypothetical protein